MYYEYHCKKCGTVEIKHGMMEEPLSKCPRCGSEIRMIFKPAAVIWKGRFKWMKGEPEAPLDGFDNPPIPFE